MNKINRLKDVEPKKIDQIMLDPIISHYYNHREDFIRKDVDKIDLLIQHIAYLERELSYADNIINENPQIFCNPLCAERGCDHLD